MERFPGRTLEEIDGMNWPRYLRAMEARNMAGIEDARKAQINGDIKTADMDTSIWEAIKEHDALMAEVDG